MRIRRAIGLSILAGLAFVARVSGDLTEYVKKAEPDYSWRIEKTDKLSTGTVYTIHLVSQTWQGIKWEHKLLVLQPKDVKPISSMLLLNTGGNPNLGMQMIALELTKRIGSPVAVVFGVPNQPLFNGKKEDALIAETFVRFLDGKGQDDSWPLLFPMVKSVVKAMDALQEFSKQEWNVELKDFVVSGASKRGWTSWLTGASDPRVRAIAPMVIDTLNMGPQMRHQVECFGKPSEMVKDYVERKLIPMPDTDEAHRLWSMVDPYFYRDRLTMPKLIINGANDPYWTVDALNLYWDDLKGEKYVCIVPNAGHDLQEMPEQGRADPIKARAKSLNAISAFTRMQIAGKPMPKLTWENSGATDGRLCLSIQSSAPPKSAQVWIAASDTRDFRKSRWKAQTVDFDADGKLTLCLVAPPTKGFLAYYGEVEYELDGLPWSLSTQVRVVAAP